VPAQPWEQQPAPPVEQVPVEPPLAKLEEDFIAMAEESVVMDGGEEGAVPFDPQPQPGQPAPLSASAIADQTILPGDVVVPQQVQLGNALTGGYVAAEGGGTVAGAGEQTADDPFGLNVTETSPAAAKEWKSLRQGWRYSRWWNISVMVVGVIILLVGVTLALYFGVFKKAGPAGGSPVDALQNYVTAIVGEDTGQLSKQALTGTTFGSDITTLLKGYEKYGIMSLKGFAAKTVKMTNTDATVAISKVEVEISDEKGAKEVISALDITEPFKLPTTVQMVQQNGEWVVSSP